MQFKLDLTVQVLVAFCFCPSHGFHHKLPRNINEKPTTVVGGVTVIDTPLVRAAQVYARQYSDDFLYNHVMRTWLFGVLFINNNATLQNTTDLEVHALGALLHDLGLGGLSLNASFITENRRFEVDSGFAATDFVKDQVEDADESSDWEAQRLQLLWDSIVLSSEPKFSLYKEATVQTVTYGVLIDLSNSSGAEYNISSADYNGVVADFPYLNFLSGVNQTLVELATRKPNSTYDSWQQAFGDAFVPHYSAFGYRFLDIFNPPA
ncbi:hypothetical protein LSUE1_G001283 [Lachnellula suecica]|uniref:HD domain-containing protein n=1 Tax=Lachnellula suecica TaxID=602035 RepID=A0A8T9CJ00_9HELO|nr:hypothetical protein LSUE1_G001283 [Lachnellula suecica]